MNGNSTAKTLNKGANSAMKTMDNTKGIYESSHQADPAGQKTTGIGIGTSTGTPTPAFSQDGAIGSMFTSAGSIGGTADQIGGPFAKDGVVGLVAFSSSVCDYDYDYGFEGRWRMEKERQERQERQERVRVREKVREKVREVKVEEEGKRWVEELLWGMPNVA